MFAEIYPNHWVAGPC